MTTKHLAIDRGGLAAPDGVIVGMADSAADLVAAGFPAATYRGDRVATVDTTDGSAWDADCQPGWFWVSSAVARTAPVSASEQVAADIPRFQAAVEREAEDLEKVLAREAISPHTDSGHKWSDDLLHALIKPNVRLLEVRLAAAKANPSSTTIAAYADKLTAFLAAANTLGLVAIFEGADKSVWRPLRSGEHAYGYDATNGGIRLESGSQVKDAVSYPDGETVGTWDALAAVEAL